MITANYEPRINRARLYAETFGAWRIFLFIEMAIEESVDGGMRKSKGSKRAL